MFSTILPYGIIMIVLFVAISFVLEIAYFRFAKYVLCKAREANKMISKSSNKKSRSPVRTTKDDKD